jgi:hypothetical protein
VDSYGNTDEKDVRVRWRACTALGLEDVRLSGIEEATVGATAVDPVDGAEYRVVVVGGDMGAMDWFVDHDEAAYHDQDRLTYGDFMEKVSDKAYWKAAFTALLDLRTTAEEVIAEAVRSFQEQQRERLTSRLSDPALDLPNVDAALEVFNTACDRRRQSSEFFEITIPPSDGGPFEVRFGHYPGQRNEVLYLVHSYWILGAGSSYYDLGPSAMYLNGVWTTTERYQEAIQHQCADPWERVGLLRAAQDLVSIHEASKDLAAAQWANAYWRRGDESATDRFEEFAAGVLRSGSLPVQDEL